MRELGALHREVCPRGSQAKNISYSTDHRQKIFRTLPQAAWFFRITDKKYFVLYRSQAINISYSTSDALPQMAWGGWEVANHIRYGIRFTVRILGGITHYLSLIPLTL